MLSVIISIHSFYLSMLCLLTSHSALPSYKHKTVISYTNQIRMMTQEPLKNVLFLINVFVSLHQ